MENLIPIVIFLVIVIVKIARSVSEYQSNRPGTDDKDWGEDDGWTPASTPAAKPAQTAGTTVRRQTVPGTPRPMPQQAPKPSDRVQTILDQLKQQVEEAVRPVPVAPAPVRPAPKPAAPPPTQRAYLSDDAVQRVSQPAPPPAQAATPQTQRELVDQTMATAFPQAMKMIRESRRSMRQPIALSARGKANLRRGILMAEVLGPPRAYDL